jgi:hypothetical protein
MAAVAVVVVVVVLVLVLVRSCCWQLEEPSLVMQCLMHRSAQHTAWLKCSAGESLCDGCGVILLIFCFESGALTIHAVSHQL